MKISLLCAIMLAAATLPVIAISYTDVNAIGTPTENYTIPDPSNDPRHDEIKPIQVDVSLTGPTAQSEASSPDFLTEFTGPLPQAKLTVIGDGKWYMDVDINTPGWLYIYEYYPPGGASPGRWIAYKWQLKQSGDWKLGPFSARENEPEGQHVYRLWFYANGQWATPTPAQSLIYWDYLKDLPELRIDSFTASPLEIRAGDNVTLSWNVYAAQGIEIPGIGPVQGASGSIGITLDRTTDFIMLATGLDGKQVQSGVVTIAVLPAVSITTSELQLTSPEIIPPVEEPSFLDKLANFISTPLGLVTSLVIIAAIIALVVLLVRIYARRQPDKGNGEREIPLLPAESEALPPTHEQVPNTRARLLLPNGMEIALTGSDKNIGRADMARSLGLDALALISQSQFHLTYTDGQYFIEDQGSTNGTLLNGMDIKGKGQFILKDRDIIEPADAIQLKFTTPDV